MSFHQSEPLSDLRDNWMGAYSGVPLLYSLGSQDGIVVDISGGFSGCSVHFIHKENNLCLLVPLVLRSRRGSDY